MVGETRQRVHGIAIREPRHEELAQVRAFMLRVIADTYGYGYQPQWHYDLDDLRAYYLDNPRHALFIAVDASSGDLVGTVGVRARLFTAVTQPPEIVARYRDRRFAELVRVFVDPVYRRRGIGAALVSTAYEWIAATGQFEVISLHSSHAVNFWRRLPTLEVLDDRHQGEKDPLRAGAVYFEMAVPAPTRES